MKTNTYIILFLFWAFQLDAGMKDLKLVANGKEAIVEWSLYLAPEGSNETNLVLIIKNNGAKFIDLEGLGTKHFSFQNVAKKIPVLRINGFQNVFHKSIVIGQIVIDGIVKFNENSSFELIAKESAFVPLSIRTTKFSHLIQKK